jgi:alginate O-acetyltransferase complex protein AlgI
MVFASLTFLLIFLPLVLLGYFGLPQHWRNGWLLSTSLIFYGLTEPHHLLTLLLLIVCSWWVGGRIEQSPAGEPRRRSLGLGVLLILAPWLLLKLYRPVLEQAVIWGWLPSMPSFLPGLPVGLSFVTFHALSYLGDIYVYRAPAEPRLSRYFLYVTIFPQLLLGPILRWYQTRPQLGLRRVLTEDLIWGVSRLVTGLAKKVLLADPLGIWVDRLFALPADQVTSGVAWMGSAAYVLRLYLDYSSYSDIALGLLRIFGFHFPENFNYPLRATSVGQFFQGWNVSIFRFFRDYLYRPLRGSQATDYSRGLALLAVWLASGFWHGVGLNFVTVALILALFILLERKGWFQILGRWPWLGRLYTLTVLTVAIPFFRGPDMLSSAGWLMAMAGAHINSPLYYPLLLLDAQTILLLLLSFLVSQPWGGKLYQTIRWLMLRGGWIGGASWLGWLLVMVLLLLAVAVQLLAVQYTPFLYFQF